MNSKDLNIFFAIVCLIAAIWDCVTTFTGVYDFYKNPVLAFFFTLLINGVLLFSFKKIENPILRGLGILALILAIVGDAYTAFKGNNSLAKNEFEIQDIFGAYLVSTIFTVLSLVGTFFTAHNIKVTVLENDVKLEAKKAAEEELKKKN